MSLRIYSIAVLVLMLITSCGCGRNSDALGKLEGKVAITKQIDALYFRYVNDEPNGAEGSLLKSIDILEKSSCFDNSEREGLICLQYSRLAVMAHKLGKKDEEEAYFVSAKYYQLKCLESANMALHEAIKVVNQMSVDRQTLLIEKMDKNLHSGKLATYNQSITNKAVKAQ